MLSENVTYSNNPVNRF